MSTHQSISDLYLAAYVVTRGIPYLRIDDDAGRRCLFVFDVVNVEAWREVQGDFVSGRGTVKAVDYANNVKTLKFAAWLRDDITASCQKASICWGGSQPRGSASSRP